jgi:hypothetical protein
MTRSLAHWLACLNLALRSEIKFNALHTIFKMFRLLLLLLLLLLYSANLFIYVYFHAGFIMGPAPSGRHVNKLKCIICYHYAHWQK